MEHRQGPQIDRMQAHVPYQGVADRVQIRAAMVIDHSLGIAGRAGGVVQGNGLPLVGRKLPGKLGVALGQQGLVVQRAQFLAADELRVIHVDDQWPFSYRHQLQRLADGLGELAVGEQDFRLAVFEHESDGFGVQPDIQGVQRRAGHRDAKVRLEHFRDVGQHRRNGMAKADAAFLQCRSQPPAPGVGFRPIAPNGTMHHGGVVGVNRSGPLDKGQRSQRNVVGRVLIKTHFIDIVGAEAHGGFL
jgi:hypothetical protein